MVKRAGGGVTVSEDNDVVRMSPPCEVSGSLGSPDEVRLIMFPEELVGVEVDITFPCENRRYIKLPWDFFKDS